MTVDSRRRECPSSRELSLLESDALPESARLRTLAHLAVCPACTAGARSATAHNGPRLERVPVAAFRAKRQARAHVVTLFSGDRARVAVPVQRALSPQLLGEAAPAPDRESWLLVDDAIELGGKRLSVTITVERTGRAKQIRADFRGPAAGDVEAMSCRFDSARLGTAETDVVRRELDSGEFVPEAVFPLVLGGEWLFPGPVPVDFEIELVMHGSGTRQQPEAQ
jgi:hypothetical protein